MRKDVKIIMAVCVIVLIGLIVYALFLPGEKKPVATTENTDNTTAVTPDQTPTTEPSTPSVATAEPSTQPSETPIALSPTTAPTETAMSSTPTTPTVSTPAPATGDWNKLLETGSSTPDTASPVTSSASSTPMSTPMTTPAPTMSSTPTLESSATPTTPTTPEISATGQRIYTVKSGDTPSSIAQAEYGNRQLYTKILAANPKLNARHMHVGQKIVLPDLSATSAKETAINPSPSPSPSPSAGITSADSASPSTSIAATPTGPHYTVASGDSLQRISIKLYGSSSQWEKIYDLNKKKIGSNPARLRVGMVLELPKAPRATAATATAAQ
jgi:nucleoid-associated protein YgaU